MSRLRVSARKNLHLELEAAGDGHVINMAIRLNSGFTR